MSICNLTETKTKYVLKRSKIPNIETFSYFDMNKQKHYFVFERME